ncbi:MAG: pirin family protein [Acidobacteria bacterium]|nr:pirin family protein [Acidobacteriota bacterium]
MTGSKQIATVHGPGSTHWVGDGFPVRNLFPSNGVSSQVDPFLMLDYAGPRLFDATDRPRGVGEHPHRGFETVTIVYQGALEHRDSAGHSGTIGPGDVQWMTAGSGVVHEEMHEREFSRRGGIFQAVQLWVNLPRARKMSAPGYQTLLDAEIPVASLGNAGQVRVIAGELDGVRGPAHTFTPLNVWDVRLRAGGRAELDLPAGHNAAVALLHGEVNLHNAAAPLEDGQPLRGEALLAVLSAGAGRVVLDAKADSTLLMLTGQPIGEPVASYGPFVMNTREEILKAAEDYNAGRMGRLE